MSLELYSLSLTNLALDGSLDLFVDLYKFTYNLYLQRLENEPWRIYHKDAFNTSVYSDLIPEFELLAFRRLRIFTTKIKNIHLMPHHFKYFNFFDDDKIKKFMWQKKFNEDWERRGFSPLDERYTSSGNEEFEFQETVIELQQFVNLFKHIVTRAIHEELQKGLPSYTIFDARKDVGDRIAERMKMRRSECIVLNDTNLPINTEPLFVFESLNNTSCKIDHHSVVSKKYHAKHIDGNRTIVLPVHYCETCGRYMIGSLSLALFREHCGKFIAQTSDLFSGSNEWRLTGESKLHQLGYNVIAGELTTSERQNILISVVESKQLSSFEVVATIEQNIRIFENNPKMQQAVLKWKSDLEFINGYMLNKNGKL